MPSGKFSTWAWPTFVTTPQSGAAMYASAVISPGWDMPISITAISCHGSSLSSCKGRPNALFRFPRDFNTVYRRLRTFATASLVVVFPAEPVMPMTRLPQCLRTAAAKFCNARWVSSTTTSGCDPATARDVSSFSRDTTNATAPFSIAEPIKSCPSSRSPLIAKNISPSRIERESIEYPETATGSVTARSNSPPHQCAACHSSSLMHLLLYVAIRALQQGFSESAMQSGHHQKEPNHSLRSASFHGPCPPAERCPPHGLPPAPNESPLHDQLRGYTVSRLRQVRPWHPR